eukprot:GGOE01031387.1.p3 GENE.GGOE01031387.1~~GGOE01031387.1.p3  ORF type:complete len:151 (-),score=1.43 GGOE01031387.1:665-1117(-)
MCFPLHVPSCSLPFLLPLTLHRSLGGAETTNALRFFFPERGTWSGTGPLLTRPAGFRRPSGERLRLAGRVPAARLSGCLSDNVLSMWPHVQANSIHSRRLLPADINTNRLRGLANHWLAVGRQGPLSIRWPTIQTGQKRILCRQGFSFVC